MSGLRKKYHKKHKGLLEGIVYSGEHAQTPRKQQEKVAESALEEQQATLNAQATATANAQAELEAANAASAASAASAAAAEEAANLSAEERAKRRKKGKTLLTGGMGLLQPPQTALQQLLGG